ncbi:MAG: hypothetical protein KF690_01920 [Bacteroidetes bacterium]|nr:hypothetical protein [Bacteroidota bacterium]
MKKVISIVLGLLGSLTAYGQDGDVLLNDEVYHLVDRLDIQGRVGMALPTTLKPYGREQVAEWLARTDTTGMGRRARTWLHRSRVLMDDAYCQAQAGHGIWGTFWTNGRDFYGYYRPAKKDSVYKDEHGFRRAIKGRREAFKVYANPVLHLGAGQERSELRPQDPTQLLFRNTRGASLRGSVFGKVGFYTEFTDNQAIFPQYVRSQIAATAAIPGEAFFKTFRTNGHDYLSARGYLTYSPIPQLRFKLGRDRAFWGDGYQSMLLSNYATDYYLLNMNVRVWKLEYQSHFTQMTDLIPNKPDVIGAQPRKYGVFHHIAFRPVKEVSIGFFENVIYAPLLPNGYRGFELQYLNPLIFYRAVEQSLGSPDNYAMGLTTKVNLWKRLQLYGQVNLDDYNFGQRKNGSGWWGNKYGLQAGFKYIDVLGIETLDLQVEANTARPYTYSHYNISGNYAHYNQPLAHPLGANFREFTAILRYQPLPRIFMTGMVQAAQKGLDLSGLNYGGNILRSNVTHLQDFGNVVLQGQAYRVMSLHGRMSYQIMRLNAFVEGDISFRTEQTEGDQVRRTAWAMLSLRWNLPQRIMGL